MKIVIFVVILGIEGGFLCVGLFYGLYKLYGNVFVLLLVFYIYVVLYGYFDDFCVSFGYVVCYVVADVFKWGCFI